MTYRASTCGFCRSAAEAMCPRCEVRVCAEHRRSSRAWCATCDAEFRDEMELAAMEASLAKTAIPMEEDDRRINGFQSGVVLLGLVFDFAARPVRKWRARARAEAQFAARSPDAIALERSRR